MQWYGIIWYNMIWYDMIWYDMIWYDIIYDQMISYDILCLHRWVFIWYEWQIQVKKVTES